MRFFNAFALTPDGFQDFEKMRKVADFIFAMDTNLAPIVGQQITLTKHDFAAVLPRVDLLRERADEGECELIAKTRLGPFELGL
ncbi:MAG: hypothetical protein HC927_11320, partial [Deltaproteobacteria bacterium]|nr:hypothetical protein [Deltaproteobacteria bacterium]